MLETVWYNEGKVDEYMHYVIGDIHGQIRELKILLKKLDLKPEDEVYFVGDWFDRSYTKKDTVEMVQWMLENLKEGSRFHSVVGNHDLDQLDRINYYLKNKENGNPDVDWALLSILPESDESIYIRSCYPQLKALIESMPLYVNFTVDGQEFLVTHSWLWDEAEHSLGMKDFDRNNLDVYRSVWDRHFSVNEMEYEEEIPIVIHGHTPTLGKNDIWTEGCRALARIHKVTEKNIDVDCCAFYSPLRGGNLAAYRCEDGAEFYAYEENDFYKLVDRCWDKYSDEFTRGGLSITKTEWYFVVLFSRHCSVFHPDEDRIPHFTCGTAEAAYDAIRDVFANCSEQEFIVELFRYKDRAKRRLGGIVTQYWTLCREE